jgi:hypothetical protein
MCASFALDKDNAPGKVAVNRTITLRNTWTKEAQKGFRLKVNNPKS